MPLATVVWLPFLFGSRPRPLHSDRFGPQDRQNDTLSVTTGLVPVIPILRALRFSKRDGRHKADHDGEGLIPARGRGTRGARWLALDDGNRRRVLRSRPSPAAMHICPAASGKTKRAALP